MDGALAKPKTLPDDPHLPRIAEALRAHFGDRLSRLVLYGSRARGDHRPDSDYDIAAFLTGEVDWGAEWKRFVPLMWTIYDETGACVETWAFPVEDWNARTVFMRGVREDGIDL